MIPVAVVGAGIGGLTLTIALREQGIEASVFERANRLRDVGAGVALSANATRLLSRLGLGKALDVVGTEPTELIFRDRAGGRVAAHPIGGSYRDRFGAPYCGVRRADLQRLLSSAVDPRQLHLGREVRSVRELPSSAVLTFDDGEEIQAQLVVGSDGVNSVLRSWVTTEPGPAHSGTSGIRGLVRAEDIPSLPDSGAMQFWMGPGAHVLHYPLDGRKLINFLAVVDEPATWTASGWTEPIDLGQATSPFSDWHPCVREMFAAARPGIRWALLTQPPLRRWFRGRVVLLGDAVHAMLPHHGQGANQTIEDAVVLANCLGAARDDHQARFARYQFLRQARTRAVQRSSWQASAVLHLPDGPEARVRNAELAGLADKIAWIHMHDVGPVESAALLRAAR
ncbi:FAD-dependent monooxygenase [Lentzea flava]|uniref:Monooxygenase n=1 Tax=Lentzea flava TaxID=103732 RepID=A0ABQ2UTV9_9PSEU|nr:FAD-dependent monooxygenase [Lentzea flava]MCP2201452.1 salicylate hydroxylase [Lentzea flava]GGU50935.1 monooxygenase [Lentzea flava]